MAMLFLKQEKLLDTSVNIGAYIMAQDSARLQNTT